MISVELPNGLIEAAVAVLPYAYSPYSRIRVSAALLTTSGRIFTGVNVENASLGLTVCAERSAVSAMITAGETAIQAILVTSSIGAIPPCGACRQVIAEFAQPETPIYLANNNQIIREYTVRDLLPEAFFLKLDKSAKGNCK